MSNTKRNFYDILNATSSASFNELKSNYKRLILQCHPDKLQQQLEITTNNLQTNDDDDDGDADADADPINLEFVAITEAWNCLKDPIKRKQYDAEQLLSKFQTHNNIYAHLRLSEMKKQPNNAVEVCLEGDKELDLCAPKEESNKDGVSQVYIYTYDCRCGGQYIVDDESAEQYCRPANNYEAPQVNNSDNNDGAQDDADNKKTTINDNSSAQNNKSRPNNIKNNNNNSSSSSTSNNSSSGSGGAGFVPDTTHDVEEEEEEEGGGEGSGELIVECSECSLVIILNG